MTAGVFSTTLLTRYQFNRRLGMLFGIAYFDASVTIEDSEERTDIDYGYTGAKTKYGMIGVKVWIFKGEIFEKGKKVNRIPATTR